MSRLQEHWTYHLQEVEEILERVLPGPAEQPALLHQAMRYSTLGGGKRLRAFLALAACRAVGGEGTGVESLMAAVEMVHSYSLIHDDLPCMDDDELRRGKPTNHIVYGEALAVLAGDALLTEAFGELARMPEKHGVSPEVTVQVIGELAQGAGSRGMVGGQAVDILSEGKEIDWETLNYIHSHKTGALFRAALRGGALLGGASPEQLAAITRYAENFGLAFQITDDILDEVGEAEQLGKVVGSDQRLGKQTYPRLFGLEESRAKARQCVEECLQALEGFSEQADLLRELAQFILNRDY